ncbi:receptor-like serine/threonine-protein kinase SD1-8 isoform X2 [Olea europaea var. sylvestris]|uniref:receptor-like serine/threonine-protein kinase SD1-8 isoform X2 n=1 Tax=Olea europaea var. sylvestris TaxID=158386 RepID=UPI000C1D3B24|nr:receptor-like serine/threonine-protein kinase SD1-8 isoform X2 [Olea europaea var. sylvestris]
MVITIKNLHHHFWCFLILFTVFSICTTAIDLITPTQLLAGDEILVSIGEEFELGFFSPGESKNWYIGIWYKNIEEKTVVWVANRDSPVRNSSGVLKIGEDGNLVLSDENGKSVWSTNHSRAENTVAELLETGNFILRQESDPDPKNYLWQSFDYPTDTLLPGMKFGWDLRTGLNRYLTSWKTVDDPGTGDFSFKLNTSGFPECFLTKKQSIIYRSGPWNGLRFSGVPEMKASPIFTFDFVIDQNEVYYGFELHNKSVYSRLVVKNSDSSALRRFTWIPTSKIWNSFWYAPRDQCDDYRECGAYGICDTNDSPVCRCMKGFVPRNPQAWNLRDGSDGCIRTSILDCSSDGFLTLKNMKLPQSSSAFVDTRMSLDQCQDLCRKNCSCQAYCSANITDGGSGCVLWTTDLLDMRQYAAAEGGQDLHVRVAASDLGAGVGAGAGAGAGSSGNDSNKTQKIIMVAGITVGIGVVLAGFCIFFIWKRKKSRTELGNRTEFRGSRERSQDFLMNAPSILSKRDHSGESTVDEVDLPLYDFSTIVMATDKFSDANKLGQGGFGCVYKGILVEGQEIAVKRLSKNSGQGIEEFKNEMKLIARLQHRNLVRLLGCCIDMEEKMLVYEYMENKSLDSILFKKEKSSLLDWKRRFNIICGIARGLLYLHQDSRFRIIHRDLKASNILLDKEMNPKISDFGMARIFGGDQTEANTKRVVGTYGYMSPEYAMDGLFSMKSDVFSFGVLVVEIVTGKKNRGFYHTNNQLNLLAHAWRLWREGRGMELMDSAAGESYSPSEVLRCIQVGLLCVQEQAEDRPNMDTVVLMLSSDTASMSQPKNPGFCMGRRPADTESSSSKQDESCTVNQVTVTILDGR